MVQANDLEAEIDSAKVTPAPGAPVEMRVR
jgi:hypothetical protein